METYRVAVKGRHFEANDFSCYIFICVNGIDQNVIPHHFIQLFCCCCFVRAGFFLLCVCVHGKCTSHIVYLPRNYDLCITRARSHSTTYPPNTAQCKCVTKVNANRLTKKALRHSKASSCRCCYCSWSGLAGGGRGGGGLDPLHSIFHPVSLSPFRFTVLLDFCSIFILLMFLNIHFIIYKTFHI